MLQYSNVRGVTLENKELDMTLYRMQASLSKTMAHPIRLAVLHLLKDGEKTVNELVDAVGASQSNVSQHLALLRHKGLVNTRRDGLKIYYSVSDPKISLACDMVRQVLLEQLEKGHKMVNLLKSNL